MSKSAGKVEEMYRLMGEMESGGYDRQSFATLHGMSVSKLDYWRSRYRQQNTEGSGFVEVSGKPGPVSLEVIYPNGITIRLNGDVDRMRLRELITLF